MNSNSNIDIEDTIYKINLNRASKRMSKLFHSEPFYKRIPVNKIEDPRYIVDEQLSGEISKKYYPDSDSDDFESNSDNYVDFCRNNNLIDPNEYNKQTQKLGDFPIYQKTSNGLKQFDVSKFYNKSEPEKLNPTQDSNIYRPPQKTKSGIKNFMNLNSNSNPNYSTNIHSTKQSNIINAFKNYSNNSSANNSNSNNSNNSNSNNSNNSNEIEQIKLSDPIIIEVKHNGNVYVFELDNIDNLELESLRYSNSKNNKKIYEGKIELSGLVSVSKI